MGRYLLFAGALLAVLMWWNGHGVAGAQRAEAMVWDAAHITALTADLSSADGKLAPAGALGRAKRVLVYFSASWCPPCRAFTPRLVEWYKAHGDASTLPLIFVSMDKSAGAMRDYMNDDRMPWWGVAFGSSSAQALTRSYCGSGIPDLVLLDDHGRVLSDSFVDNRYVGPQQVLAVLEAGR